MNGKKTPRIAVIGCGYWGANHVRTLAQLGALVAVSDNDASRAAPLAQTHGVPALALADVLADSSIDAVVCALPADQHPLVATAALNAGKHVFVEKPIALSAQAARAVADLADAKKLTFMAGHILRYHTAFGAVMEQIESGAIGEVRHVQSHRLTFGKFHQSFDALWDLGPHDMSLVLAVTGEGPNSVASHRVGFASAACDSAHVHMGFANGMTAHVIVSRHSAYRERKFVATGTKGMIVWDDFADWPQKVALFHQRIWQEDGHTQFELSEPRYLPVEPGMALTDELAHFIDCVQTGRVPLTSGRQGVDVIDVLERASAQ